MRGKDDLFYGKLQDECTHADEVHGELVQSVRPTKCIAKTHTLRSHTSAIETRPVHPTVTPPTVTTNMTSQEKVTKGSRARDAARRKKKSRRRQPPTMRTTARTCSPRRPPPHRCCRRPRGYHCVMLAATPAGVITLPQESQPCAAHPHHRPPKQTTGDAAPAIR